MCISEAINIAKNMLIYIEEAMQTFLFSPAKTLRYTMAIPQKPTIFLFYL